MHPVKNMKLLLKNCNLKGRLQNILIFDNIIDYIGSNIPRHDKQIDIDEKIVISGVIDPHTHMRDLNLAYKEDWKTGSFAAARGGVTTVFDMPNSDPPTINLNYLKMKKNNALSSIVNFGLFIGAAENNLKDLEQMLNNEPDICFIPGIKIFMSGSNSNEVIEDRDKIKEVFKIAKRYSKPVVVHAELQSCVDKWRQKILNRDNEQFKNNPAMLHNTIRNRKCAVEATKLCIDIAKEVGNVLYIAHVSTKEEIEIIRKTRKEIKLFCEITAHHLLLDESNVKKSGNFAKVNPPLRQKKDCEALLNGLLDGTVDTIGSDHAPHSIKEKKYNLFVDKKEAPSGFPGVEIMLPLLLTQVNNGKISLDKLEEITSKNCAEIFNLEKRGEIKEGNFADISVVDMKKKWEIDPSQFVSKAHYSPFDGFNVQGDIELTIANGNIVYSKNRI